MKINRSLFWLLASLCLAACAKSQVNQPTLPPPVVVTVAHNIDDTSPQPLSPTEQVEVATSTTSAVAEAGGLKLDVSNFRLADYRPDKDRLSIDLCFEKPDDREWYVDGVILSFNGGRVSQFTAVGFASEPGSTDSGLRDCLTLEFNVPAGADLSQLGLEAQVLRTTPTFEQICGVITEETQQLLDERHPGIKIDCRLTELGYEAWVTHKPEAMSLDEAQQAYEQAGSDIYLKLFAVEGPWVFSLRNPTISRASAITLLNPADRPPAPDLKFSAINFRRDGPALATEVCFQPPDSASWFLSDVVLEYGEIEAYPVRNEPTDSPAGHQCQTLVFDVPENADLAKAILKVYSIGLPESTAPEACENYRPELQAALDARDFRVKVACDYQSWGWQIVVVDKPATMSDEAAALLVHTDELLSIKGFWPIEVRLNK